MKKIQFALSIISCIFLFSCKNFMNGDFLEALEHQVEYQNSASFNVYVTAEAGVGTFKKGGGDKSCRVGDQIEIEFEVMGGYKFIEWKATSENGESLEENVSFEPKTDKKTVVTFLKAGDVYIIPVCILYPSVEEYEPKYNWLGVECDTPIVITFNTLIDADTLTSENITITNKETAQNYSKYFTYTSEENENRTILTLKPDNSIKELFTDIHEQIDLTVDFNKDKINIKGKPYIKLMGNTRWNYRINAGEESVLPFLKEVSFYKKGPDENGQFDENYKLTDLNFDSWSEGDFSQNHVKDLYVYVKGYDADSGLSFVRLAGNLIKSANGEEANINPFENRLGTYKDFKLSKTPEEDGSYYYEYYSKIDFSQQYSDGMIKDNLILNDGLVKFDVSVVDRAGNDSFSLSYYVIKDTTVTENRIRTHDTGITSENDPNSGKLLGNISDWDRVADENGIDTVLLYFTSTNDRYMNDPFFTVGDTEYSDLLEIIDVKWGYDLTFKEPIKNNGNPGFSANSVQYEIKRDENRESYISISVKDSVGNTHTRIIAIPEKNRIIRMEQDSENQNLYNYDYKFFSENCPLNPTETTISFSFGTKDKIWEDYSSNTPDNRKKNYFGDNKIDLVNDPVELYIGGSYVPQGAPYYTKAVNCYSFDGWDISGTNSGVITITSILDAPLDKYIPQKITSITNSKPNRNEGFVTVKAEFSEYEKNNDYEYFIGYKSSNMDYYSYSKSKEFTVTTGYVYTVKPFIYKDGKYFCHSNAEEEKLILQVMHLTIRPQNLVMNL